MIERLKGSLKLTYGILDYCLNRSREVRFETSRVRHRKYCTHQHTGQMSYQFDAQVYIRRFYLPQSKLGPIHDFENLYLLFSRRSAEVPKFILKSYSTSISSICTSILEHQVVVNVSSKIKSSQKMKFSNLPSKSTIIGLLLDL